MKSIHKKMSFTDFKRVPPKIGWKKEYYGGKFHRSPCYIPVHLYRAIRPVQSQTSVEIRAAVETDRPYLENSYAQAFKDTIEYCDWKPDALMKASKTHINLFYKPPAENGIPISRIALIDGQAVGGAMVIWHDGILIYPYQSESFEGLMLQCLFVDPKAQRKKIATAIVAELINILQNQGWRNHLLWSFYTLGNETSEAWHQNFGGFETDFDYHRHLRLIGLL